MPDNLVSKGNQTMKLGELMKYNMRNIFLQKLCPKYGGENSSKNKRKKNGHISASAVWSFIQFAFVVYSSWGLPKYIESKVLTPYFYLLHIKLFQNIKGGLELVSLSHFLHGFWRKIFLTLYSITWPHFIV